VSKKGLVLNLNVVIQNKYRKLIKNVYAVYEVIQRNSMHSYFETILCLQTLVSVSNKTFIKILPRQHCYIVNRACCFQREIWRSIRNVVFLKQR
jgi:hypothetical protein